LARKRKGLGVSKFTHVYRDYTRIPLLQHQTTPLPFGDVSLGDPV
jgi:hypothetical protein